MILTQKKFQSHFREAFKKNIDDANYLLVRAADKEISINYQALSILSPYFRSLISSSPCCTEPTLILPEYSASSIALFVSLVTEGTTADSISSPEEAAEIIKVAKVFDIDASDYSVVVQNELFSRLRNVSKNREKEPIVKVEKDSEVLVEVPDKEEDTLASLMKETLSEDHDQVRFANVRSSTDYVSLDETVMSNVSQSETSFVSDGDSPAMSCQVCNMAHTKLSLLLNHYMLAHFMKEARSEFRAFATSRTCNLCGKECKTSQQLNVHIGVKHKKVNNLLVSHGYKEHMKPNRGVCKELVTTQSEVLLPSEDLSNSFTDPDTEMIDSSDKKASYTCQLCDKTIEGLSFLWQHYTNSHFTKDIKQCYGSLMDLEQVRCKLCDKRMKQKQGLIQHIGAVHHKVNEVLVKYGLNPLEVKNSKY